LAKVAERVIGNEPKFDDAKLQANPSRLDGIEPVIQRDVPTATGGSSAAVSSQQQIVVVVPILALFMFSFLLTPIFRF
jgi:hypothetical protein